MSNTINADYKTSQHDYYTKEKITEDQPDFMEKLIEKQTLPPEEMTLDQYKSYFKEKMDALYTHPSQRNRNETIVITDAAYERMKTDPEYEKKVLNAFATNKAVNFGGFIPVFSYAYIDDTWEKSYGYTQGMKENTQNSDDSSGGIYDWWEGRHERMVASLEAQILATQKRRQMSQIHWNRQLKSQQRLENFFKERVEKGQGKSRRQVSQVSAAYDANILTLDVKNNHLLNA